MTAGSSTRARARRRARSGRGVLILVGTLLVASGALRAVDGTGMAIAREIETRSNALDPSQPQVTEHDLAELLDELRARENAVIDRERAIETRIAAADMAEARIGEALRELERAEQELRATMAIADEAAENDLRQLTAVYENMKPQQAAPLFAQMSPAFAAGFLGRMRPDAAAAILSGLNAEAAYAISVVLASRNAEVPRPIQSD